ncbi:MAG: hypothetical protein HPY57_15825 [Ignavibacteria bacterium]|nr:hypothetical protein [Ignavibacteria bacterium]
MTKIAKIKTLDNAEEFINILKDKELLIYEDVQGSKIFVRWDGKKFIIKPKSLKSDPLNFIDLTVQKFYNQAYLYFHSLPDYITELMKRDWWFCFEYFPDNQPANIVYNRLPKNNLILTCIVKGSDYIYEYDELLEYSKLFDVEPLPIVFKGTLSTKQLEIIQLYLNTNENDLKYVFDEDNFAYFFYKILNPRVESSFLMNQNKFNDNLEKIVIKIDGKSKYSFEILNPLYRKMELINNTEHVDTYSLILLRFLEFSQLIDIEKYKLSKITKDELYVEFISNLFNEYMKNNEKNILAWDFVIPSFFKEDKFKINIDLITNEETKNYIKSDNKIEYVFKCILGAFNTKKKKPIGVFTNITLELFNGFVDKLDRIIDKALKINREYEIQKDDLKNFKDYFNIKYEVDVQGDIYPDMYDEFEEEGEEKKKESGKELPLKKKTPQKDIFGGFTTKKEEL